MTANAIIPYRNRPSIRSSIPVLNQSSSHADGLVLWIPATILHKKELITGRDLTISTSLAMTNVGNHGSAWETQIDNTEMAIVEDSDDGEFDFGLSDPFTLSLWVVITSTQTGALLCKAGSTATQRQYQIFTGLDPNAIESRVHGSNGMSWGTDVRGKGPTLVTLTKSGAEATADVSCYINGIKVHTNTAGTDTTNNADVIIGARRDDDTNGGIAFPSNVGETFWDIRIYNRELSSSEVFSLYHPATRWDIYWQPKLYIPVKNVQDIESSVLTDADILFDGKVDLGAAGSLHTDADIFNQGFVEPLVISGSLFTDADTLLDGGILRGDPPGIRIINVAVVVGGGGIVDLVDEVVLKSPADFLSKNTVVTKNDTV